MLYKNSPVFGLFFMEPLIQISKINDFLYSPRSLYLHSVYESFDDSVFHATPQKVGRINHKAIDKGTYSTSKRYVTNLDVYSEEFGVVGKIDIYDSESKTLIERKTKISKIYQGHRMQVYAQYFCLIEMGYEIEHIVLRSLQDNKVYKIALPGEQEKQEFMDVLARMRSFDIATDIDTQSRAFADISIYNDLSY